MQINNRLLDDFARVTTGALGIASGMRKEAETLIRERAQRLLGDMDLVSREEFDAVRAMAAKAREEQEALGARIAELEARLGALGDTETRKPSKQRAKPRAKTGGRAKA